MRRKRGANKGIENVNRGTVYCECVAEVIKNSQQFCVCMNGMNWVGNKPATFICSDCRGGVHRL